MTHHVIFKYSNEDSVNATINKGDEREDIFLEDRKKDQYIHTNLNESTAKIPFSSFQKELLYFAMAIYSADRRISRSKAYDKWTRDIHIYFPVIDTDKWKSVEDILRSAVSFLTGDRWAFTFYPTDFRQEIQKHFTYKDIDDIDAVTLLSGGLDSFIGAVDLLESVGNKIMFVSHHPLGGMDHSFQKTVANFLDTKYPNQVKHIDLYAQPKGRSADEDSSRSRAFMYFIMGITVTNALGCSSFIIPENGFMSLNVPLTNIRIGSLSTRSTHPYFVDQMQELIEALGISVSLITPYQFKTKGEMITESRNIETVQDGYTLTRSCSTLKYRFKGHSTKRHCGVCFPCIVRRTALHKAGFDPGMYSFMEALNIEKIDGKEFPDLWAVKAATQKHKHTPPTIFDIIGNAPIARDIDDFLGVYTRGIEELVSFLSA